MVRGLDGRLGAGVASEDSAQLGGGGGAGGRGRVAGLRSAAGTHGLGGAWWRGGGV